MKNIHLIPTDKASRLYEFGGQFISTKEPTNAFRNYNICITNDKKIKEGDWYLDIDLKKICKYINPDEVSFNTHKKIILATHMDLIADGVQSIPDEFLEWFCKNSSYEWVSFHSYDNEKGTKDYELIIPKQ